MPEHLLYNDHVFQYPHMEGVWEQQGLIVGWDKKTYPKLFIQCGSHVETWKDGLNDVEK